MECNHPNHFRAAPRLKDATLTEGEYKKVYKTILGDMRQLYQKAKLIHGDLSEFNILYHNKI